jgi:hypothetical protein
MSTANHYIAVEGDTMRVPFPGFEAAKNYAQAMRVLNYATMLTVENGFWIVTASKAHGS